MLCSWFHHHPFFASAPFFCQHPFNHHYPLLLSVSLLSSAPFFCQHPFNHHYPFFFQFPFFHLYPFFMSSHSSSFLLIDYISILFIFYQGYTTYNCSLEGRENGDVSESYSGSSEPYCTNNCHHIPNCKGWQICSCQEIMLCWKSSS